LGLPDDADGQQFKHLEVDVPQKGQTSDCLAGFHSAAAPHAGQENFFWAMASGIRCDANQGSDYHNHFHSCQ
jgi:hypothetical protein